MTRSPERLSGLDASFVYIDNARVHMHTLKLLTLDLGTVEGGYSYRGLVRAIHIAAAGLPNWCSKLAFPEPRISHPYWVPDPHFDIRHHIDRIVVADDRELDRAVSASLARPLPLDRPLWRATIIEAANDDRVSVALEIHHSLADGMAFARVLESITTTARDEPTAPPRCAVSPTRASPRRLLHAAARDWLAALARLPWLLARTLWSVAARLARRIAERRPLTLLFRGPRLPFNARLGSARVFARASVDLGAMKRIKNASGTTLNDVMMATAAEALRRWMLRHGLDPSQPLVAGMPVSAEGTPDPSRCCGNMMSHVPVCLHTNVEDPIARLYAIHRASEAAKADLELVGNDMLARWSELTVPGVLRTLWRIVPRLPRPPINLVLANVPGPKERLSFAGAEVEDLTSVGPILDGVGLNITAWSYGDRLNYGLLAVPEQVPDLDELAGDIEAAAAQLEQLAEGPAVRPLRADARQRAGRGHTRVTAGNVVVSRASMVAGCPSSWLTTPTPPRRARRSDRARTRRAR